MQWARISVLRGMLVGKEQSGLRNGVERSNFNNELKKAHKREYFVQRGTLNMILSKELKIALMTNLLISIEIVLGCKLVMDLMSAQAYSANFILTIFYITYAIVLTYCNFQAVIFEYNNYYELHQLKDELFDFIIMFFSCLFLLGFSFNSHNFIAAIGWLALYAGSLTVFVGYTISKGLTLFFNESNTQLQIVSMLDLLSDAILCNHSREDITHWNEYRYWLILDGGLAILFASIYFVLKYNTTLNDFIWAPRLLILLSCYYLTLLNRWRYKIIIAKSKITIQ